MKTLTAFLIFLFIAQSGWSQEAAKLPVKKATAVAAPVVPAKPKVKAPIKAVAKTAVKPAPVLVAKAATSEKESSNIDKTPKAIFLIKRAKVDADIGEPVLYPFDRQLSNLYYDLPNGVIRND